MLKPFQLRIPADLKAFIAEQAARNLSSQNSEIVRCIRERKNALTTTDTPNPEGDHEDDQALQDE